VTGGYENSATGDNSAVGGGYNNTASGNSATVGGGGDNTAYGEYSFAAGHEAMAVTDGSFVWSDYSGGSFSSTVANQFAVSAAGGVVLAADVAMVGGANSYHNFSLSGGNALGYLYGSFPALADGIHLGYNYYYDNSGNGHVANSGGATSRLTAGYGFVGIYIGAVNGAPTTQRLLANSTGVTVNGTFNNSSDRNLKQNFAPISPSQILEKVGQLPVTEWSYKEDPKTRHVGPVAQDFYSTFNIGTDDKHIAPIDEGGVALAAIQGLNQKVDEQRVALQEKETEVTELKQQLDALKQLVNQINQRMDGGTK
jgi:trimeric autotransporter adhesin